MKWLRHNFFAIDVIFLGFLALLTVLSLASIPGRYTLHLLGFLAIMAAVYVSLQRMGLKQHGLQIRGQEPPRWLWWVNLAYLLCPLAMVALLFLQLGYLMEDLGALRSVAEHPDFAGAAGFYDPDNASAHGLQLGQYGAATYFDLELKRIDIALFGVYPPDWARQFHSPWRSAVMQYCYLSYYIAPVVALVPLMFRRQWRRFRLGGAVILGCLLLTFAIYLLFPATGPRFEGGIRAWLPAEPGVLGAQDIYMAINNAETFRWNAFPSGHVAVSLASLVMALKFHPKIGAWMVLPVLGLCLSTIYMGYHYGIDVLAGIACTLLAVSVLIPATRWWERGLWPKCRE